jgi:hypothetical protein
MMAANSTSTSAPPRLLATVQTSLAPTVNATRRRNPFFARGEDVEVRRRLVKDFGNKELVIYLHAKVVSVSAGTFSYLVQDPAANSVPGRTARVHWWKKGLYSRSVTSISHGFPTRTSKAGLKAPTL